MVKPQICTYVKAELSLGQPHVCRRVFSLGTCIPYVLNTFLNGPMFTLTAAQHHLVYRCRTIYNWCWSYLYNTQLLVQILITCTWESFCDQLKLQSACISMQSNKSLYCYADSMRSPRYIQSLQTMLNTGKQLLSSYRFRITTCQHIQIK